MTVTASEAADYIHEMLEGLHAMASQPANQELRFILWQAMVEAKRVMDDERKTPSPSLPNGTVAW